MRSSDFGVSRLSLVEFIFDLRCIERKMKGGIKIHKISKRKWNKKQWNKKQIPKSLKGNFTIEMSIILPLILLIISSLLYLLFFLYDESSVQQIGYLAALRGVRQVGSEEEKIKAVNSYCEKMQKEYLWAVKHKEASIEWENSKVSVLLSGQVFTPLGNKLFKNSWTYQISESAKNYMPVTLIRQYKKLQKVVKT